MKKRQIIGISLATALACTSFAGCSKNKVREIEGADKDTCKFIGMVEEVYDMKGIQTECVMDISSKISGDEGIDLKATITEKSIVDSDGNMSTAISVKCDYENYHIDNEIAKLSYIENNIYVDLSGAMTVAKNMLGEVAINETLSYLNMSTDDLGAVLCFSIPTGDVKASDFKITNFKDIMQSITDDYAIALSEAKALTVDDGKYTIELNEKTAKTLAESFVGNFEKNGSDVYDKVIAVLEGYKADEKFASAGKAVLDQFYAGIESAVGQDMGYDFDIEEAKKEIADAIKDAKDNKDEYLKKMVSEFKTELEDVEELEDAEGTVKAVFTDEKDGYSVQLKVDASATEDDTTAKVTTDVTVKVSSTSEKVSKPEKSVELSKTIEKVYNVISLFFIGGNYDYEY